MRIAFYVSGKANVMQQIIKKSSSDLLNNVEFIFSEDATTNDIEDLLKISGGRYFYCDFKKLTGDKNLALSDKLLKLLLENNVDYLFCFGRHILKGDLLNNYKLRIVNFHPAILPQFRGVKAIDQALAENVSVLGNTAHFIDEGVDTGPIIAQNVMSRKRFDKLGYRGVLDTQVEIFWLVYKLLDEGRVHVIDNNVEIDGASYDDVMYFPNNVAERSN